MRNGQAADLIADPLLRFPNGFFGDPKDVFNLSPSQITGFNTSQNPVFVAQNGDSLRAMICEAAAQSLGLKMILRVDMAQHPFISPGAFENSAMGCGMLLAHEVIAKAARTGQQAMLQQQHNTVV